MAFSNVRKDVIPYQAGALRITPLDADMRPILAEAYTTDRNLLLSTQVSEAATTETIESGNGENTVRTTGTTRTLTVSMNYFDQKLHSMITGSKLAETVAPILYDSAITLIKEGSDISEAATYTFPNDQYAPVKDDGTTAHIEAKDSRNNTFVQSAKKSATELTEEEFMYDPDTRKITFNKKYVGAIIKVAYYIAATDGEQYNAPDKPSSKVFQVETMGEMQSASTFEPIACYQKMVRAAVSGDIAGVTKQKSLTNTITYTFNSVPVPKGVNPFVQTFKNLEDAKVTE